MCAVFSLSQALEEGRHGVEILGTTSLGKETESLILHTRVHTHQHGMMVALTRLLRNSMGPPVRGAPPFTAEGNGGESSWVAAYFQRERDV